MRKKKSARVVAPYPRPSATGGVIIRKVIAQLKLAGFTATPELLIGKNLSSDILIACSGGVDSLAMAHLLVKYGRRVVNPARVRLLYVDHGLRADSAADGRAVARVAKGLGVRSVVVKLDPKTLSKGESLEAWARVGRKAVFRKFTNRGALVLTAHQKNDLAETVLWRLMTGQWERQPDGILTVDRGIVRPLLGVTRAELIAYLISEGLKPILDPMNDSPTLLRTRIRNEVFPALERVFPRATEHLATLALQSADQSHLKNRRTPSVRAFGLGPHLRAHQWEEATKQFEQWKWKKNAAKSMKVALTDGWVLEWETLSTKSHTQLPREAARITLKQAAF